MAIVTGELYKGFTFGGISSKAYGVYITQEAAYNAPDRDVEVVEIAGRNGAYILDKGRFKNITVSYKCGIALDDEQSFESAIRTFRNALSSKAGKYVRLEDEYNANEYRQAAFLGGIEVDMADRRAGEFTVSFDAKPQRFLKSGETAVTIGGDVTNTQTESGSIVSIESDGVDKVTSLVAQIEPVQAGSGDPSPTNVRPITGWTQTKVFDTGKNLADESTAIGYKASVTVDDGYISVTKSVSSNYPAAHIATYLRAGVTYTVSATCVQVTTQARLSIRDIAPSDKTVKNSAVYTADGQRQSITYTPTKSGMYRVALFSSFGAYDTGTAVFTDIQCEIGSTATPYEPFTGTTTTTALGRTVYGGTVDVVTGVLTVTHASVDMGTLTWTLAQASGTNYFRSSVLSGAKIAVGGQTSAMCSAYKPIGGTSLSYFLSQNNVAWTAPSDISSSNPFTCIRDERYSNATAFKSAVSGVKLVYELATPQTYNLTAQQVKLLTGDNNVWTDTGDITITWGDDPNKLVNPTLYNANPLLSFTASGNGSGNIIINNNTISVTNKPIGDIVLANVVKLESGKYVNWQDTSRYLSGDAIRIESIPAVQTTVVMDSYSYANYTSYRSDDMDYLSTISTPRGMLITHSIQNPPQFVAGTTKSAIYTATVIEKVKEKTTGDIVDNTIDITVRITYDGLNRITVTSTVTSSLGTATTAATLNTITVNSTKQSLVGTAYIDLDIGEAYSIDRGAVVSINDSVSLGASLPVLKPGVNIISKTGAVKNLKVTPRWWEL